MRRFSKGEPVVFEEIRQSQQVLNRNESPAPDADGTMGIVCHYMTVLESRDKGTLVLLTQGGKMHVTHNNHPNLRRASWWERFRHRNLFPRLNTTTG